MSSLARVLGPVLVDDAKRSIVIEMLDSYIGQLRESQRFEASQEPNSAKPSSLLWALYTVAYIHDQFRMLTFPSPTPIPIPITSAGDLDVALRRVDEALSVDDSDIDVMVLKARILKHSGAYTAGHKVMDQARVR